MYDSVCMMQECVCMSVCVYLCVCVCVYYVHEVVCLYHSKDSQCKAF